MAIFHLVQQGKGGVGKSMVAIILYQVLKALGKNVHAFDIDPANKTMAGYKEFDVVSMDIMKGNNIDKRAFDRLFDEHTASLPEDAHVIVDSGASSFIAFTSYLKENDAITILQEAGHVIYFHTVVTGGQAILDTLGGLKALAEHFPTVPIVVWLNPYFGEISMDGKSFEEFKVYKEHHSQFSALIKIPDVDASTLGKDLQELYAKRQSFAVGMNSSKGMIVRGRMKRYWNNLLEIIGQADFAA